MPDPISIRSLRETQRRVREIGAYGGFVAEGTPPETTELHLVRWNRAASSSTSLFPGYRYLFEAETDTKTNVETIWLRTLTGGPPGDCYFWAKLTGQHSDGVLIYTPVAPLKFKAKLTSRTAVSCGSSGSAGTAHTVYEYAFIGAKLILDGDGCPAWVDTELGPDISGTSFEKNNRKVATGTIVDIEVVFRQDLSASGSGSSFEGIASGDSCVYVFDADGATESSALPVPTSETSYRYFCDTDNHFKEYLFDGNGNYTLVRDTGVLCGCCGVVSGSGGASGGTGSGHGLCCAIDSSLCIHLHLACAGEVDCDVTLVNAGISNPNFWFVHGDNACGISVGWMLKHNNPDGTCDYELALDRYVITGGTAPRQGIRIRGFANSITCSPLSITFASLNVTIYPISGSPTTCSGSATIVAGACPAGSGSGGTCPCQWICHSLIWTELTGNPACTGTPAFGMGLACDLGNEGQVVYTNTDGTACTPGGGSGTPGCGDCGTANRTATPSGGTGFLATLTTQTLTYTGGIWISPQLTFCGNIAFVVFWCENGTWYAGLKGAGFGFQAQAGGTCSSMTFHLTYGTDNTLCPGQSGAVTLTVTT